MLWVLMRKDIALYSVKYDVKSPLTGGTNNLFRLINYHIHGHGQLFLKNYNSILWSEEVIGILWRIFLSKQNVLFSK